MRFFVSVCGALVLLLGSISWGLQSATLENRRARVQQRRADFSPDPPPIPEPTPTPQPQPALPTTPNPGAQAAGAATPAAVQAVPENLPPATPPQVSFSNGLLTVTATNSNLGALLTAIRNKTGIQFEGMENSNERVAIAMGPAPEGDVLAAILAGSGFDYVVMERPDSPGIVQRVLLSPKGGAAPGSANAGQSAANASADADDDDEDTAEEPATPQDTPVRPPVAKVSPQQLPPQQKTPEQLLDEIKRMPQAQAQPSPAQNQAPIKPH